MSLTLLYFAWIRERTGVQQERVELPADVRTVADLIDWLKTRGPGFEAAFARPHVVRAAVDQAHVKHDAAVTDAREVAFFPPVTGG